MAAHSKFIQSNFKDLLKHPLAESFLHMKWQLIQKLFMFNIFSYSFFLLSFTIMSILVGKMNQCDDNYDILDHFNCTSYNKLDTPNFMNIVEAYLESKYHSCNSLAHAFVTFFAMTIIGLCYLAIREFIQMVTFFKQYKKQGENFLEAAIVILTIIYLILLMVNKDLAIHFGAWAVFLGWWDWTMLMGRIPSIGIYIFLTLSVMKDLAVFFLMFLPMLLAFALVFHLLLPSNEVFTDLGTSLIKVFAMMVGEFDLEDNFLMNPSMEDNGQWSTQLAFILFLLIGNIVIANLLIGLTVSKTEQLFKVAGVLRLKKTVEQICNIDKLLQNDKTLKFWKFVYPRTKLLSYFSKMLDKDKQRRTDHNEGIASPWKVCVMPHSPEQVKSNSKAREFLSQASFDSSTLSFEQSYYVYLYDDFQGCPRGKLPFEIPAWIIAHTLTMLNEKQQKMEAIKSAEIEKEYDELQMDSDDTDDGSLSKDHLQESTYKADLGSKRDRKVSQATPLQQIDEDKMPKDILKQLREKFMEIEQLLLQIEEESQ